MGGFSYRPASLSGRETLYLRFWSFYAFDCFVLVLPSGRKTLNNEIFSKTLFVYMHIRQIAHPKALRIERLIGWCCVSLQRSVIHSRAWTLLKNNRPPWNQWLTNWHSSNELKPCNDKHIQPMKSVKKSLSNNCIAGSRRNTWFIWTFPGK